MCPSLQNSPLALAPKILRKILRLHTMNQTILLNNITQMIATAMILIGTKIKIVRLLQIMFSPFLLVIIPYDFFRFVFGHKLVVHISRKRIMLCFFFYGLIFIYACLDISLFFLSWIISLIFDQLCYYHIIDDND